MTHTDENQAPVTPETKPEGEQVTPGEEAKTAEATEDNKPE